MVRIRMMIKSPELKEIDDDDDDDDNGDDCVGALWCSGAYHHLVIRGLVVQVH